MLMLHRVSFGLQQESEKVNNNKIIKKKKMKRKQFLPEL